MTRCSQWSYRLSVCHHRVQGRRLGRQLLGYSLSSVWGQATGTMLITVFVFPGIEGASVYSRMARKREDVGRATVIGFLGVLSVFALVTLVSYGVMPQGELAGVSQPSMAAVLESVVGHWGSIFIRVGVIVSVLGAYLAWTLMAAEVLCIPAKTDDMPIGLARIDSHRAPVAALIMAAGVDLSVARRAAVRRGRARFHAGPDRRPLLQGMPRTWSACFLTRRSGAVRRDRPRGRLGCGVLGYWGDRI